MKRNDIELESEGDNGRKRMNSVIRVLVILVLLVFVGRAVSVSFSNRLPRSDVDKTQVYEQMRMNEHRSVGESHPVK